MGAKIHWAKGKESRPSAKVPNRRLSGKGCEISYTARRFA